VEKNWPSPVRLFQKSMIRISGPSTALNTLWLRSPNERAAVMAGGVPAVELWTLAVASRLVGFGVPRSVNR